MLRCTALLALIAVAACSGERQGNAASAEPAARSAEAGKSFPGWGPTILELIPERGSVLLPSLEAARGTFAACGLTNDRLSGKCDIATGQRPSGKATATVAVSIQPVGADAKSIILTGCCSTADDFFRPFDGLSIIRSELICPEFTISASESVQAFRISAAGKRDFLVMRNTRAYENGRAAIVRISLSPIRAGEECSALIGASDHPVDADQSQNRAESGHALNFG